MKPAVRKALWAFAIAGTAAAVAWVDRDDEPIAVAPTRPQRLAAANTGSRAAMAETPRELDLDRIDERGFDDMGADLFAAKSWYVPPPVVVQKPKPPPLPFAYGGRLIESDRTLVFLLRPDRTQAVRTGDLIDNVWRVDAIGATAMTLTYLPLNESQTLALGANP